MFYLFHHILISHYIMNPKVGLQSLYRDESYVTLVTANSMSGLIPENNTKPPPPKDQKHSYPIIMKHYYM